MAAKDDLGRAGEERAARYLSDIGYVIVDRNWRCRQGEIDIVAITGEHLAVVEVKTRRTTSYGHPFEALDARKVRRLWQLAHAWISAHAEMARGLSVRIEAVGLIGSDPETALLEHLRDLS